MNGPHDFINLYNKYIPDLRRTGSNGEWVGHCPLPECKKKNKARFYANEMSGLFHCKLCGEAGNIIQFCQLVGEDYSQFCNAAPRTEIDLDAIECWHNYLLIHSDLWRSPWSREVIESLKIGWDPHDKTEVYPISNKDGEIVNVIHHKKRQIRGSEITLYPLDHLARYDRSYVLIIEGLPDAVSALSCGLQAVTSTGGSSGLPVDLSALADFRYAFICPDNNEAGERGAELWTKRLRTEYPQVHLRICDISKFVAEDGDLTDYFSLKGKSRGTFIHEVLKQAQVATLYSDLPNFIRDRILSEEFRRLDVYDQALFFQLGMRASRYRSRSITYRGLQFRIPPGGYWCRYSDLLTYCPFFKERMRKSEDSIKPIRSSIGRLIEAGFIRKENLNWRRGLLITLTGWPGQGQGHNEGHRNPFTEDLVNYPLPPLWEKASQQEVSDQ